ncbi:MAG: RNA methyltransferase [Crenarchaeota archaeon]|nr:RNA methyltransferase [Thermoproteota archaeon]
MKYLFRLDASNLVLSYKELDALIETYTGRRIDTKNCISSFCIIDLDVPIFYKITSRSGYVKEAGRLIALGDRDNPVQDIFVEQDHLVVNRYVLKHVRLSNMDKSVDLKDRILRSLSIFFDKESQEEIVSYVTNNLVITSFIDYKYRATRHREREPSRRPFFRSIALPIRLSRALINLARVKEGDTILDPFAGTGSILIESHYMGLKSIGIELDWKICHGCAANLNHYRVPSPLILADSTEITLSEIDGIATDPPYGRAASTHGESSLHIYMRFIGKVAEWLRRGGRAVFMSPTYINKDIEEVLCRYGLILVDKIYMYVHGGLTRTIYVVEKP